MNLGSVMEQANLGSESKWEEYRCAQNNGKLF